MSTKTETQVETVTMTDGRIVDFAGKRKLLKESSVNADGKVQVRLDFRNGETRLFTLPDALLNKFAAHGAEQKLGDEIAGLTDTVKREANGMAGTSVLVRALVEHTGKTVDAIKQFLSGKSQAEKVALRNNPKIKPIVERIEAEKASKKANVDTDAMLGELEA